MIATNHNRCSQFTRFHHRIECEPGAVPLAEADPADACRQALKRNALACHIEPAMQVSVVRE